jgi:hypothetical protein
MIIFDTVNPKYRAKKSYSMVVEVGTPKKYS